MPPVTMGHEVSGIVAEVGQGVTDEWSARAWCRRRTSRPAAFASGAATGGRTCVRSGGRSGRSSTAPSQRRSSCPRGTCTAFRTGSTRMQPRCASRSPVSASASATRRPSPPATRCSSPGRGRSAYSPPRSRARSAATCLVPDLPDEVRLETARALGFETATAEELDADGRFDVVIECSGAQAGRVGLSRGRGAAAAATSRSASSASRSPSARPRLRQGARRQLRGSPRRHARGGGRSR